MPSVGQVYYDVLPNLDGFAAKVAAGLGGAKPIRIPVEVDSAKAAAGLKGVSAQTDSLSASSTRLAAAQGRVRVTAAQLNETRQKATAGSSRLIAAEERYATALRGVRTAQEQDARVAARAIAVRENAAARSAAAARRDAAARKDALQSAGTGLAVGGAATLVALGGIVKVTADFEQAVSHVASTGKEARASIGALREEAIRYGASTSFSAREAANAQEELIKANVSVTDTLGGGLKGALDLAAASSIGVADAAGIVGTALSQFQLDGTQASHVADLLAAGAGKAQGEVQDFAEALKYVGPNAQAAGVSIEETVGVLAEFANQGILGSQAGTSLRSMLVSLTAPVGASAKALERYGVQTRNAAGEFVGFEAIAGELQKRLGNLGQAERDAALARIFGKNSLTAATVLYEGGAASVKQWTDAVNESGFASDVAKTKMDNLRGDVERLGGAFQSEFIETASGSQGGLRAITQAATGLIEITSRIPDGLKNVAFIGAGLLAATALGAGGIIKLRGAVSGLTEAFGTLGISSKRALLATGGIGVGIAAAAAVLGHFAIKSAEASARTDDLTQALLTSKGAIDGNIASLRAKTLEESGALKAAQDLGITIEDVTQASLGNAAAQDRVSAALNRARDAGDTTANSAAAQLAAYNKNEKAINLVNEAVRGGTRELEEATKAQRRQAAAADAAAKGNTKTAQSFRESEVAFTNSGSGARDFTSDLAAVSTALSAIDPNIRRTAQQSTELASSLFAQGDAFQSTITASSAYQAAIDSANETLDKNGEYVTRSGKALADGSAKGRENIAVLTGLASSGKAYVQSLIQQGAGAEKAADATRRVRGEFVSAARDAGLGGDAARRLADSYGLIPERVSTTVEAFGLAIQAQRVKDFTAALDRLPERQRTEIISIFEKDGAVAAQRALERIRDKTVIARARAVGEKDVRGIGSAIRALKDRIVSAKARGDKRQVDALNAAMKAMRDRQVKAQASTYGTAGVRSLKGAVDSLSSKTITITTRRINAGEKGGATGGYFTGSGFVMRGPDHLYTGGRVRGTGGPREDNIAAIDRATGVQTAWISPREFVVNAKQTEENLAQIERINRGGKWDIIPRRASGGLVDSKAAKAATSGGGRSLTLNLDLGPVLGGIQKIVLDLVEDRDEYYASVGRMS